MAKESPETSDMHSMCQPGQLKELGHSSRSPWRSSNLLTGQSGGWDQSLAELQFPVLQQASVFWPGMAKNSCDISGWKAQLHKVTRGLLAALWPHISSPHLPPEFWQQSKQKLLHCFLQDFSHPSCPLASLQAVLQVKAASSKQKAEMCLGMLHRGFCPKFCSLLGLVSLIQ